MKLKTKKISVDISFYFAAVLTLSMLSDKTNISCYSILSALLHETGHLLCLLFFRANPKSITLSLFGMRIVRGAKTLSYKQEIMTALSGPLVNLFLFAVFLFFGEKAMMFSAVNLALGLFNLLPVKPMDGGEVLYFSLCRFFNENTVRKISDVITVITALILFVLGVCLLIKSGYNFMLLVVSVYIVFYLYLEKKC